MLSKVLEKLILQRLQPTIKHKNLIPNHQFGFRQQHSTIEQVNRVYQVARRAMEQRKYCTAAFLDVSQAFDKVWHPGLLYKLKQQLPVDMYRILSSYLSNRHFLVRVNNEVTKLHSIASGVPQGSVLGPLLYILFTADFPLSNDTSIATYADDTVIMAVSRNPMIASIRLQNHLDSVQTWLKTWRIKANESKSIQVTFTLNKNSCPAVIINNITLHQSDEVKYLGIYLDRRLTWRKHIFMKRKQLGLQLRNLYWLVGKSSKLSFDNKILIYKSILKPVWTYGIQLWGTAAESNLDIIQRFQSKVLRLISNAPWYINNNIIHRDSNIQTIRQEIQTHSSKYIDRLRSHTNSLAILSYLTDPDIVHQRLIRYQPLDLPSRFQSE